MNFHLPGSTTLVSLKGASGQAWPSQALSEKCSRCGSVWRSQLVLQSWLIAWCFHTHDAVRLISKLIRLLRPPTDKIIRACYSYPQQQGKKHCVGKRFDRGARSMTVNHGPLRQVFGGCHLLPKLRPETRGQPASPSTLQRIGPKNLTVDRGGLVRLLFSWSP